MDSDKTIGMAAESCKRLLCELSSRADETLHTCGGDQVHDLRVSIRRFNQALRACEFDFSSHKARKMKKRIKKTMLFAGEVRNLDVAMECLRKWHYKDHDSLLEKRQLAATELIGSLNKWVDGGCEARLKEELGLQSLELTAVPLEAHARGLLSSMAGEYFQRGNEAARAGTPPQRMHGFRIAAKKFRYSMELFAETYGPTLNGRIEQVRQVQSILGEINDCVTMRGMISGGLAGGRLRKRQQRKIEEFQRFWTSNFAGASVMRAWVDELALLTLRKGPALEREYHRAEVRLRNSGPASRRHATGG